jgi:hypothetical protein
VTATLPPFFGAVPATLLAVAGAAVLLAGAGT